MDEYTTWALCLADMDRNRPGVSINLTCYPGPYFQKYTTTTPANSSSKGTLHESFIHSHPPTIELIASVTKIGRNCDFIQPSSSERGQRSRFCDLLRVAREIFTDGSSR
jgi:hypothetical protein